MAENTEKPRHTWSVEDNIVAYALYCITPLKEGKQYLDCKKETLELFANIINTSPKAVSAKLQNFQYLYNKETNSGDGKIYGLLGGSTNKKAQFVYEKYKNNWEKLKQEAENITGLKIFNQLPLHGVFN